MRNMPGQKKTLDSKAWSENGSLEVPSFRKSCADEDNMVQRSTNEIKEVNFLAILINIKSSAKPHS
jgi:hypothetical protein